MREINPKETTRAYAFEMWLSAALSGTSFSLNSGDSDAGEAVASTEETFN